MVDPMAIPILLKAVDFLFGEGSKILEERKERRKKQSPVRNEDGIEVAEKLGDSSALQEDAIKTREEALQVRLSETSIKATESKLNHLLELLDIHRKNYQLVMSQYDKWGSALVPQIIMHNLEEAEDRVLETTRELQEVLSKVYGKPIQAIKD